MVKMAHLVSIVTPMFNAEKHIEQTIASVQSQTYQNWELLIADDGSSDGSVDLVRDFAASDDRIKLIPTTQNTGPAGARNRSIAQAQGRYLSFLDSDDFWRADKLQVQLDFMANSSAQITYSNYQQVDESGENIGGPIEVPERVTYQTLLNSNAIPCLTALYDTKMLGKQMMESVGHEDYVYWLSLLKSGCSAQGLNEVLAFYRVRQGSVSNNKLKAAGFQWNIYRNIEELSLIRSLYHFSIYTYQGLKKHRTLGSQLS